tara:strand:- start:4580 stop:5452 length:873 start_codon:yes stop_codon:yes gene_type:complete
MALTTITTVATTIPEVWSKITNDTREKNLILAPLLDRRFESENAGNPTDKIHVQGVDDFAGNADAFSAGDDPITFTAGAFLAQVDIAISRHYYTAFAVQHDVSLLANIPLAMKFSNKAAYRVSLELDTYIAGFFDANTTSANKVGALGTALEDDDIIESTRILNAANVPFEDRHFYFSTDQDAEFKKVERYVNNDYSQAVGSLNVTHTRGLVANLHGMSWYTSTNVEGSTAAGHDNGFFHREWAAIVQAENLRIEGPSYDLESDSDEYAVHNYYGVKEMRPDHVVWGKGK